MKLANVINYVNNRLDAAKKFSQNESTRCYVRVCFDQAYDVINFYIMHTENGAEQIAEFWAKASAKFYEYMWIRG